MAGDMTQFTDEMLSQKVFSCASCDHLLTTPIMQVEAQGTVCGKCFDKYNWKGVPIPQLEAVLSKLKIPCKFTELGCKERVPYMNVSEHETACKFFQRKCIMEHIGCEWQGVQGDFLAHFTTDHPEDILANPHNCFKFELPTEAESICKMMLRGKRDWIFCMNADTENLYYRMFDLKSTQEYSVRLKHMGTNQNCVEVDCHVGPMTHGDSPRQMVNINALELVTESYNKIKVEIRIDSEMKEIDERMLQHFECPVCKTVMRPPIYQCKFGHSFCSNCRPRLESCPNCRGSFGTTRNYSLEGLTAGINYSCVYHHLGCETVLPSGDISKHESHCSFKPYPCPLEECTFNGTHSNIVSHLQALHVDKVIPSGHYKATSEFRLEPAMMNFINIHQKFYMVFDENIFRLTFKRNTEYSFWAVEVLRKKEEEAVFIYDIGVIDMRKPDRKLKRCDLCFTEANSDDLFKKCILFPNNILASYASNGLFTYYCKIHQRK